MRRRRRRRRRRRIRIRLKSLGGDAVSNGFYLYTAGLPAQLAPEE